MSASAPGAVVAYVDAASPLHRCPLWVKYLCLVAVGVLGSVYRTPAMALALTLASVLAYALAGPAVLRSWATPLRWWWWVFLGLGAFQWFANGWEAALGLVGTMWALLQFARLLLLTTQLRVLLDGAESAAGAVGLPRERVHLTMAMVVRTLPDLSAQWRRSREAARARGLRRGLWRTSLSLTVASVARARDAGDALRARGLPEE